MEQDGSSLGDRVLQLTGLAAFAVAQPLFDLLGREPRFFVARGSASVDIVLFAVLVVLLPALALATLSCAAALVGRRSARGVHYSLLVLLVAAIAQPVVERSSFGVLIGGWWVSVGALAVGAGFVWAFQRFGPVRQATTVAAVAAVVFPILFLAQPPVRALLAPAGGGITADPTAIPATEAVQRADSGLLLVFDGLPLASLLNLQGEVDAVLYPNFAWLATEGAWFRQAVTVSGDTLESVPAILTGVAPKADEAPNPSAEVYPRNLLAGFGSSRAVTGFESVTRLCPRELCSENLPGLASRLGALGSDLALVYLHVVAPPPLRIDLPQVRQTWFGFAGKGERWRRRQFGPWMERFLDSVAASEEPGFWFAHIVAPHEPWLYYPTGTRYLRLAKTYHTPGFRAGRWAGTPAQTDRAQERHLMQLQYCDQLLGRVLARLRELGRLERTWVVVTADHGVGFQHGLSYRRIDADTETEILRVPLFIKPAVRGGEEESERTWRRGPIDTPAETIDIAPTLAEVLDLGLRWPMEGRSLAVLMRDVDAAGEEDALGPIDEAILEPVKRRYDRLENGVAARDKWAELRERKLADLRVGTSSGLRASIIEGQFPDAIEAGSDWLPGWIVGGLEGDTDDDPPALAVVVNGVVWDTTVAVESRRVGSALEWQALIPEEAFQTGQNELQLFAIEDSGSGPKLRPVPLE